MNTKIYFIQFFHCMYVPNLLHICTKNCRPRRALVYKGFSKNAGLDEANQTKRIILPEPFVLKNRQRDFPHQKALLSEEHVSLMRNCPFSTHFYRVNDFYFCPGKACTILHFVFCPKSHIPFSENAPAIFSNRTCVLA